VRETASAEALAVALADGLLAAGGAALLGEIVDGPLRGRIVLLPRTQERASRIAPALRDAGAVVVEAADSETARSALAGRVPSAILFPSSGSVDAIAGYLATLREEGHRPIVAAMGPSSSASAGEHGWPADVVAPTAEIGAFVQSVTRFLLETEA
jgi:uroporphyrinogen-III synthase